MQGSSGSVDPPESAHVSGWLPACVVDPQRLVTLDRYDILDTMPEQGFDDVVRLATRLCAAPIALVSLVAANRQWFKARIGFPFCETDLDRSVCAHALAEPDLLIIPDLTADPRTAANPLVVDDPFIRFYAGAPLRTPEGQVLGTLCVIDTAPRPAGLSTEQADDLRALANQVMALLSMRRAVEVRDQVMDDQRGKLRQGLRVDVIAKASIALATAHDPAAVLEPILTSGAESVGFEQCFIYDLTPGGDHLDLIGSVGVSEATKQALMGVSLDGPLCGIVVQTRRPLVLRDVQSSTGPRYALARQTGINGFAGYPVMSRGDLVGVISFTTRAAGFDEDALSFFSTLAALVSGVRDRLDGEKAVRESDTRSRLAQEAGCVGTFEMDVASGLMKVSSQLCRIYGLVPAPLYAADKFVALVVPEDGGLASSEVSRPDGSAALNIQYRIRRADDGALRWIERNARFVRHADGTPASMLGTVRDITDQRTVLDHLARTEEQLRLAADATGLGIFDYDIVTGELCWDARVRELFGVSIDTPVTYEGTFLQGVHPDDRETTDAAVQGALDPDGPGVFEIEYRVQPLDGGPQRWLAARGQSVVRDRRVVRFIGTVRDVTVQAGSERRKAALVTLGDRLREATTNAEVEEVASEILGTTLEVSRAGYACIDIKADLFVVERDWTAPGIISLEGRHGLAAFRATIERSHDGQVLVNSDLAAADWLDGDAEGYRAIGTCAQIKVPLLDHGELVGFLYVHQVNARAWTRDEIAFCQAVADRTYAVLAKLKAEAEQQVLNEELSHRLKNTLALVLSIASQSLRGIDDRAPVEAFEQRIHALSSAHDSLMGRNWAAASIQAVARAVMKAAGQSGRVSLSGPFVEFSARAALSLSLLLHELATNAVKHGSLSMPEGRVDVAWRLEGEVGAKNLVLDWRESGGPLVSQPAADSRRGFGSRLIQMGLTGSGGVEIRYQPIGLHATMRAPISRLRPS